MENHRLTGQRVAGTQAKQDQCSQPKPEGPAWYRSPDNRLKDQRPGIDFYH